MDLETRKLQQLLSEKNQLPEILMLKPITTSTNDDVKAIATQGVHSILICSAQQTQGRGQQQKTWVSPQGNIYLSALLNLHLPIDGRIALEVALNILQMPSLHDLNLKVKWPNDLFFENQKFGGILIEPISNNQVVVGVGLNLNPIQDTHIEQKVTSLTQIGLKNYDRIQLIAELYEAIQQAGNWFNFQSKNLANRFNHHAAFLHQTVNFSSTHTQIQGCFLGIQNDGAVKIQTENSIEMYYQGQMRLVETE